jgi:phenylacetate-coenzyme A ligase PaaK-like adenylate-forming protein
LRSQARQLRRLRAHAYAHSPFYQDFHKGLTGAPLRELPVLTKSLLMEHFDDLATDRAVRLDEVQAYAERGQTDRPYLGRYWVTATSGSSGRPGFFLFDQAEWIHVLASFGRGLSWSGAGIHIRRGARAALVASAVPWHVTTHASATVRNSWVPILHLAANEPAGQMVRQLNEWQPEILGGYAAVVGLLAEEQLAGRLQIGPRLVYASAELLTPGARQRIRQAWGSEPFDLYGATETAGIAAEQARRRLRLFEPVDRGGGGRSLSPPPAGEFGDRLLVTTLFSRTQPLIRYELNDSLRVSADAPDCGLPFALLDIQGRVDDPLDLPAFSGGRLAVQSLVFHRVMDILPVSGWQVTQQADDGLSVSLAGAPSGLADEAVRDQVARSLAEVGVRVPYIQVRRVDCIPKTAGGKALLIEAYHPNGSRHI